MSALPRREEKAAVVRAMFNGIAHRYDLMNTVMTAGQDRAWRRFAVRRAGVRPAGRALDVCCGTGMLCEELAKAVGGAGGVVGLDFSEKMLAVARERFARGAPRPVTLVQGTAMALPFPADSFDGVTVGWGLRNVPDMEGAIREMARVVRPGGRVVSLDMGQPELPVVRQLYWLCFEKLVPAVGKLLARDRSAYDYLHDSARAFPHPRELAALFGAAGLADARHHNLSLGAVAVVEGTKPAP